MKGEIDLISVNNLTKLYQGDKGIVRISFCISEGESFGFLGPNGAGKTTTIRILMGFIKPDKGQAIIKGWDCWKEAKEIKKIVGYLPGEISLIDNMTGKEFLHLILGMHENKPGSKQRINKLMTRMDIDLNQSLKKMSKGTKQKIGIISTFMLDPEIYILDEPTSGLDPLMQQTFVDLVNEEKGRGKTFFISSHLFPEIRQTCERVGVIRGGKLMAIDEIEKLLQTQERIFEIELAREEDIRIIKHNLADLVKVEGRRVKIKVSRNIKPVLEILASIDIIEFKIIEPDLEQLFIQYFKDL